MKIFFWDLAFFYDIIGASFSVDVEDLGDSVYREFIFKKEASREEHSTKTVKGYGRQRIFLGTLIKRDPRSA